MNTLVLSIQYDGADYCGWQIQNNGLSIQQTIETAIEKLTKKKYKIIGAGRTDAGVHSSGQIAHCTLDEDFRLPHDRIKYALNSILPDDIRINQAAVLDKPFHSRFDAVGREYSYTMTTEDSVFKKRYISYIIPPLDFELLKKSEALFLGRHNFTTFSKHNPSTLNYVCEVSECCWQKTDESVFRLKIVANRFVYGMVRSIVGCMFDIAKGKRSLDDAAKALELQDRNLSSTIAPPNGLNLEKIYYPYELF